jgi:hypothetical protein
VYVPWLCGSIVDRHGHQNTSSFVADLLQQHAGLEPVAGNLSPMIEVTLFERANAGVHLLHLVNSSGHRGVSCVEPVAMRDLEVVIPYRGQPSSVAGLVGGDDLEWRAANGTLTIGVPELGLFEAVRIAQEPPGDASAPSGSDARASLSRARMARTEQGRAEA